MPSRSLAFCPWLLVFDRSNIRLPVFGKEIIQSLGQQALYCRFTFCGHYFELFFDGWGKKPVTLAIFALPGR